MVSKAQTSWIEQLKDTFDIEKLSRSLDLSFNGLMNLLMYLCAGFFVGFFFKKFMHYLLVSILISIGVLYIFNILNIVVIDIVRLKSLFGISPTDTVQSLSATYLDWMKSNVPLVVSATVGFIIGYKVG